jgi:D-alanyl-D-alanine carboxypeptidase/D-alanyl-D-alanine-endopeptidase (penicillin-binding protein 4)
MELLVKEIGARVSGSGSTAAGLDAVRAWMIDRELPTDGVVLDDGSGLSDRNRVTCALLSAVLQEGGPDGLVAEGLARPGQAGTLDDRLLDPQLVDRVRAKTGTLRNVTALSGWVRTEGEVELNFSIVQNRPDGVGAGDAEAQQRLLSALLDYPERPDLDRVAPSDPVQGAG